MCVAVDIGFVSLEIVEVLIGPVLRFGRRRGYRHDGKDYRSYVYRPSHYVPFTSHFILSAETGAA